MPQTLTKDAALGLQKCSAWPSKMQQMFHHRRALETTAKGPPAEPEIEMGPGPFQSHTRFPCFFALFYSFLDGVGWVLHFFTLFCCSFYLTNTM